MELTSERKYQLLLDISHKVRDTLDLDEIMDQLLDAVKNVLDYDAAGIFVLNQDLIHGRHESQLGMIAGIAGRGFDPNPAVADDMLMHGRGISGFVIQHCESVVVPDVRLDPRYVIGRKATRSEIAVPIIRKERAIGALNLESDLLSAYTADDIEVLQFFADAASISIEKAMLHKQLMEQMLVGRQLETAREVQLKLLPGQSPRLPGYDICGSCIPTDEIGGDYFDYIPLANDRLGLAIADVSGHGVPSALVMTAFRALLRTEARLLTRPADIASTINQLLPEFTGDQHYVTMLFAELDPPRGALSYIACGHPLPLLIRANGEVEQFANHNPALGIFQNVPYSDETKQLGSGDILVLYTDGVIELMDENDQVFGRERLVDIICKNQQLNASDLMYRIIRTTADFSKYYGFLDDFTLVIVKREVP